ncbi:MAG: hypothetical protein JO033_12410, partial [Acidobacteriaceae bacterium]|nr:hypothetical protein [Acidobacteriaceae bacterium]
MAAVRRFSRAEIKLLDAVSSGLIADYRSSSGAAEQTGCWGEERTISAEVVRAILGGTISALRPTSAGMRIMGARIAGELQLASLHVPYPLELVECRFDSSINLNSARLNFLSLAGSRITRMDAEAVKI